MKAGAEGVRERAVLIDEIEGLESDPAVPDERGKIR
jgi:hypothetical protein